MSWYKKEKQMETKTDNAPLSETRQWVDILKNQIDTISHVSITFKNDNYVLLLCRTEPYRGVAYKIVKTDDGASVRNHNWRESDYLDKVNFIIDTDNWNFDELIKMVTIYLFPLKLVEFISNGWGFI